MSKMYKNKCILKLTRKEGQGMKAQKLLTTNVQGGFFVPESVLAGGG